MVYSQDWGVHSTGLRPGVVYGVGRDQGLTSKTTVAILAAAAGKAYEIPFRGPVSWLHAGEVASAFLAAVSKPRDSARVFDINGIASTVEDSLAVLKKIAPQAAVSFSGSALPFPMGLSDEPVRGYLGEYGSVPLEGGNARDLPGVLRSTRRAAIVGGTPVLIPVSVRPRATRTGGVRTGNQAVSLGRSNTVASGAPNAELRQLPSS